MRALIQRVTQASVTVDDEIVGEIGPGLLILLCAMPDDDIDTAKALAIKISKLRIFHDTTGKMNLSVAQSGGSALVVSQFTLAADTSRGNRPGFSGAARPETAKALYQGFSQDLRNLDITVATGQFGATMSVALVNDGPVTLWLDTDAP